jgi:Uma2 family endonuclease
MADAGLRGEDDRVELLEAEVVEIPQSGARHDACVDRVARMVQAQVGDLAIVRVHGSIAFSSGSEPRPDIAVLRWRRDFYAEQLPGPRDVLLVVEVVESSVDPDRERPRIYARAGISETWMVDLSAGHIEEFSDPNPGGYAYSHTQERGDKLRMAALPQVEIDVGATLG